MVLTAPLILAILSTSQTQRLSLAPPLTLSHFPEPLSCFSSSTNLAAPQATVLSSYSPRLSYSLSLSYSTDPRKSPLKLLPSHSPVQNIHKL